MSDLVKDAAPAPLVLSTKEAARLLATGQARVRRLVHEGKLRGVWYGPRLVIPRDAITEFLATGGAK